MDKFRGSCLCGNVKISFSLPVTTVVQCHCQSCRKMQGSDYSSWIAVPENQFSVDLGSELISTFKLFRSSKSFCSTCGTCVYGYSGKHFKRHKVIPLGIVENYSADIQPQVQVYTENKAEWLELQGSVPISSRTKAV